MKDRLGSRYNYRSAKNKSGINRRIVNDPDTVLIKIYEKINDTDENWLGVVENYQTKLFGILPFFKRKVNLVKNENGIGNEFIKHKSPRRSNPLLDWYHDENLKGVINHTSNLI